jgi:hypothetical protein
VKTRTCGSSDISRDPFRERRTASWRWRVRVLGANVEFSSNSRELMAVARQAFARVPQHTLPSVGRRVLRIELHHAHAERATDWINPPKPALSSADGLLFGHVDAQNFVVVDPGNARAFIQVIDDMLLHRHLLRCELIEFAAITLATRAHGLVPLHAGCIGVRGRGVLLLGSSGSGKSTMALHATLNGLDFLAEDSVFVQPKTLLATGLSAYVHARADGLRLIADAAVRRAMGRAPQILRRSGVRKREIDLRGARTALAPQPLQIVATVLLSGRRARGGSQQLMPLSAAQLRRALRAEQAYASGQPGWREFERRVLRAGRFRLDRASPESGVSCLLALLQEPHGVTRGGDTA